MKDILHQQDPANHTQQGIFPDQNTRLYLLKRATHSNNEMVGDIILLNQLRSLMDVVPRFGKKANPRLMNSNSLSFALEFWLNKYLNKELFLCTVIALRLAVAFLYLFVCTVPTVQVVQVVDLKLAFASWC